MVDVFLVPQRLEDRVAKTHDQNVLHRFLAEIMVDAKDLSLIEGGGERRVHVARAVEVAPDRLFDNHARERSAFIGRRDQAGGAQLLNAGLYQRRRDRQVENAVSRQAELRLDLLEPLLEGGKGLCLFEGPRDEEQRSFVIGPDLFFHGPARKFFDAFAGKGAKVGVAELAAAESDDGKLIRQQPVEPEIVDSGQELALGEIAATAEDYQGGWLRHEPVGDTDFDQIM